MVSTLGGISHLLSIVKVVPVTLTLSTRLVALKSIDQTQQVQLKHVLHLIIIHQYTIVKWQVHMVAIIPQLISHHTIST